MKVKSLHLLFLSFCFLVVIMGGGKLISALKPVPEFSPISNMTLIAHAGGGLPQGTYSNAREAFDLAQNHGLTLFETDFHWTQDGELVLTHDWQQQHYKYFSRLHFVPSTVTKILPRNQANTTEIFLGRKMNFGLHQMSLASLLQWLENYPNAYIVTDVKNHNLKALELIKQSAPNLQHQFIVQIYAPEEYDDVWDLGYEKIIFTAYRSPLNNSELATFAARHKLYALTVPFQRVTTDLAQALRANHTDLFAHTVNDLPTALRLKNMGVTG